MIADAPRFATFDGLVRLKKKWITSVAALNHRLHTLGLTSDWQYRGMCIDLVKRGRDHEPEPAPRETSLILPRILSALRDEGVTRSRIAAELSIPRSEIEQLLFSLTIAGMEGGRTGPLPEGASAALQRVK